MDRMEDIRKLLNEKRMSSRPPSKGFYPNPSINHKGPQTIGLQVEVEKTLAEQVADLLQRKPLNFDVTFSVGPQKIQVQAVKILLKAASPVFEREFEQNWENAVIKEGEGIPLPKFDPTVFQLFVKLIISDTWSYEALNKLNLAPSDLLSLLGLCRHYKITKAIKNLEKAASGFIQNFNTFKDTPEFLKMPRKNLKTILSCEEIPMDETQVFQTACRWAEHQCQQKRLEPTGENYRKALGSCFYEIRFPTMQFDGFTKMSIFKKNLFTAEEKVGIFEYIGLDESEKAKFDKNQLPFKTNARKLTATKSSYGLFDPFEEMNCKPPQTPQSLNYTSEFPGSFPNRRSTKF